MTKRKTTAIILLSILGVLMLGFGAVYFMFLHHYKGTEITYNWQESDTFDISKIATVEKQQGKDFVILNFADIQIADLENFFNKQVIFDEMKYLVSEVKPDLITLTGDQVWSNENVITLWQLVNLMDSFEIPWAPVFGNHDCGNEEDSATASRNYQCDLYGNSKYCLFSRGPSNIGTLGNYVVNITENGEIVESLYMLNLGDIHEFTTEQIAWVKWNANGIKTANNGKYPTAMCFFHRPLPQHRLAYYDYYYNDNTSIDCLGIVEAYCELGGSTSETNNMAFFEMAKSINVKDIVCGHEHTNNFSLLYQGVRMTFALKTGEMCFYWDDGEIYLNGATTFTLSDDGMTIANHYVPRGMFPISEDNNQYAWDE